MSQRRHISKTRSPNFTKFSAYVSSGRGLVLLWRRCNEIFTSGFVDDVMGGVRSIMVSMYACRCLSSHLSRKPHFRTSPIFCVLPVAVSRFISGGVAICCVLPVLWITSYVLLRSDESVTAESNVLIPVIFRSTIKISMYAWWVAHPGRNLLSTIVLFEVAI